MASGSQGTLHRLWLLLLDGIDRLPAPQAEVLATVLR